GHSSSTRGLSRLTHTLWSLWAYGGKRWGISSATGRPGSLTNTEGRRGNSSTRATRARRSLTWRYLSPPPRRKLPYWKLGKKGWRRVATTRRYVIGSRRGLA